MPVTRVAAILPYTQLLDSMGAPVERLLNEAKIPVGLLNHPAAVVPLANAFHFGELACQTQGTEHLGLHVGVAASLENLGAYGQVLQNALTVHEYLRKGIALYNMLTTGQHLRLSNHGEEFRLYLATDMELGVGAYQSHMQTVITTIAKLREAAGPEWSPREVSLAYRARENIPETDLFAGSRVIRGSGETYLTIPRRMLGLRFPDIDSMPTRDPALSIGRMLPQDLAGVVMMQIEHLISGQPLQIDTVAESLAMNARSLQRNLAKQALSYSRLLSEARMRKAAMWLVNTDKPIAEIASELGYRNASNFTRAFRQRIGVPPRIFRSDASRA